MEIEVGIYRRILLKNANYAYKFVFSKSNEV